LAINLNDIMAEDFQIVVEEYVARNKNLLDTMSKYQTAAGRLNRAVTKAATQCGCISLAKGDGRRALLPRRHVQRPRALDLRRHAQGKADALRPGGLLAQIKEQKKERPVALFLCFENYWMGQGQWKKGLS